MTLYAQWTVVLTLPTVTLTSSPNPSYFGQLVTFTATVVGSNPTGSVVFSVGSNSIGLGALTGGVATFSTSSLALGTSSVTAQYGGDSANKSVTSAALQQTVTQLVPSFTSSDRKVVRAGTPFSFVVSAMDATGAITEKGALPDGLTWHADTHILSGIPAPGSGPSYPIVFTATSPTKQTANQRFTLTVDESPFITSLAEATIGVGEGKSIYVTSRGYPYPTLTFSPLRATSGVTFADQGDGVGIIHADPTMTGTFKFMITSAIGQQSRITFHVDRRDAPGVHLRELGDLHDGLPRIRRDHDDRQRGKVLGCRQTPGWHRADDVLRHERGAVGHAGDEHRRRVPDHDQREHVRARHLVVDHIDRGPTTDVLVRIGADVDSRRFVIVVGGYLGLPGGDRFERAGRRPGYDLRQREEWHRRLPGHTPILGHLHR